MQERDFAAATAALTTARLSNYRTFFGANTEMEAYGLYLWNEAVSIQLFRALSLAEVALRNRFHVVLSSQYGALGYQGSKDWYKYLSLSNKSVKALEKILLVRRRGAMVPRNPPPAPDDVISKLTFGFWPHLLDVQQDVNRNRVDWSVLLPRVLSGHRQRGDVTYWRQQSHRDEIFARLDLCNWLRNRIAHHEPIWKAGALLEERRDRTNAPPLAQVSPPPRNVDEALVRLKIYSQRINELIGWMSPALLKIHLASETSTHIEILLTNSAIGHYRNYFKSRPLCIDDHRSLKSLKKSIRYLSKKGAPVEIYRNSRDLSSGSSLGHWVLLPY